MPTVQNTRIQVTVTPEIWARYTVRAAQDPDVNRPQPSQIGLNGPKPRAARLEDKRRQLLLSDAMERLEARTLVDSGHHEGESVVTLTAEIVSKMHDDPETRRAAAGLIDALVNAPQRRRETMARAAGWTIEKLPGF